MRDGAGGLSGNTGVKWLPEAQVALHCIATPCEEQGNHPVRAQCTCKRGVSNSGVREMWIMRGTVFCNSASQVVFAWLEFWRVAAGQLFTRHMFSPSRWDSAVAEEWKRRLYVMQIYRSKWMNKYFKATRFSDRTLSEIWWMLIFF